MWYSMTDDSWSRFPQRSECPENEWEDFAISLNLDENDEQLKQEFLAAWYPDSEKGLS